MHRNKKIKTILIPIESQPFWAEVSLADIRDFVEGWIKPVPMERNTLTLWTDYESTNRLRWFNRTAWILWQAESPQYSEGKRLAGPIAVQGPQGRGGKCKECPLWVEAFLNNLPGVEVQDAKA
jgi:hypothetical protein